MKQQQSDERIRNLLEEEDGMPTSFNKSLAWQRLAPRLQQPSHRKTSLRAGIAAMAACLAIIAMTGTWYHHHTSSGATKISGHNEQPATAHYMTAAQASYPEKGKNAGLIASNKTVAATRKHKPRKHLIKTQPATSKTETGLEFTAQVLPPAYNAGQPGEQPGYYAR